MPWVQGFIMAFLKMSCKRFSAAVCQYSLHSAELANRWDMHHACTVQQMLVLCVCLFSCESSLYDEEKWMLWFLSDYSHIEIQRWMAAGVIFVMHFIQNLLLQVHYVSGFILQDWLIPTWFLWSETEITPAREVSNAVINWCQDLLSESFPFFILNGGRNDANF